MDFAKSFSVFNSVPTPFASKGKSTLGQSEQFKSFRSTYALRQLAVDLNDGEWRFYDGGPKNTPVLLCLPGASGTAECFYRIMDGLVPKGYRVVAAQHPPYYTMNEFVIGMDAFLDALEAPSVHILGASLGGLLAQQYATARPKRVLSIILCNSFYSTKAFEPTAGSMVTSMYQVTPYFVLKNMLLTSFNNDAAAISASPEVADASDFVVEQINTLSQENLASRLTLNCSPCECSGMKLTQDKITIIDALDKTARPPEARDELYSKYSDSKQALCRTGGDFPFLSVADEVCLYVEVHMRRVGVLVNKPQLDPAAVSADSHSGKKALFQ